MMVFVVNGMFLSALIQQTYSHAYPMHIFSKKTCRRKSRTMANGSCNDMLVGRRFRFGHLAFVGNA